jgi:hypothetical protein
MKKSKVDINSLAFRLKEMTLAYPSIFPNEDAAIDHLYLTIGNGYEWKNGALVYEYANDEKSEVRKMLLKGVPEHKIKAWVKKQDDIFWKKMNENDPSWKMLKKLRDKYKLDEMVNEPPRPLEAYTICEYSAIWNVPKNAKPDWVTGAYRAAVFAMTHDAYDKQRTRNNHIWVAKAIVRLDKMFGISKRPSRK